MALLEVVLLFFAMNIRIKGIFDPAFWHAVARMTIATAIMAIVSYILVSIFPLQAGDYSSFYLTFPKFIIITGTSFAVYLGLSKLFKLHEANPVLRVAAGYVKKLSRRSA